MYLGQIHQLGWEGPDVRPNLSVKASGKGCVM